MMFVSSKETAEALLSPGQKEEIDRIRKQFQSPEEIDDHPQTAPSKRLLKIFPDYRKTINGPIIIERTGLHTIRKQCVHFDEWITGLEQL